MIWIGAIIAARRWFITTAVIRVMVRKLGLARVVTTFVVLTQKMAKSNVNAKKLTINKIMDFPDFDKVIEEMMKEQAERMRSEIFGQIFPPFNSGRYYSSKGFRVPFDENEDDEPVIINAHRRTIEVFLIIERPKGSVDLLSPEGEVLMRDGKLVD